MAAESSGLKVTAVALVSITAHTHSDAGRGELRVQRCQARGNEEVRAQVRDV